MTGHYVLNVPWSGTRIFSTGTQVGTYTVNCDGTGTVDRTLTSSTGVVTTQVGNFIITKAVVKNC